MIYVLFAGKGYPVKIGAAANTAARITAIQGMSPIKLRPILIDGGNISEEHVIHDIFRDERKHGEWFALSERLRLCIKTARIAFYQKSNKRKKVWPYNCAKAHCVANCGAIYNPHFSYLLYAARALVLKEQQPDGQIWMPSDYKSAERKDKYWLNRDESCRSNARYALAQTA